MSPPSPPPTPDPYKTAASQQMANVEVAVANTVLSNSDEYTPHGSVTFAEIPGDTYDTHTYDASGAITGTRTITRWAKTVTLNAQAQGIFDQQQLISAAMNTAALTQANLLTSKWQNPFTLSQLPAFADQPIAGTLDGSVTYRTQIREIGHSEDIIKEKDEVRERLLERLSWQVDTERDSRLVKLANMGIAPGTEAYEREMRTFDRRVADERLQVETVAGQEHSRLIEISRAKADFHNKVVLTDFQLMVTKLETENRVKLQTFDTAQAMAAFVNSVRSMMMQEYLTERSQTVNEITALMHGGQVQVPRGEAFRAGRISDTPVGQYVYQSSAMDFQKWQVEADYQQKMIGGMMSMAGSIGTMPMNKQGQTPFGRMFGF